MRPFERSLSQARDACSAAQADPHVARYAPAELARAQAAARGGNADAAWVSQQAYLAAQQARIAQGR